MDINKDTIVKYIGPFESSIKFGFLLEIFCELYDLDYVDEIIQELNQNEESNVDDAFLISVDDESFLKCSGTSNIGCEDLIIILEKVFKQEFYYMRSDDYNWNADLEDTDLKTFIEKQFVDTIIESSNKTILEVTTKNHSYYDVTEINEKNFLTNDEKILDDSLSKNDEAEKSFSTSYQYYYIRKKDFNKENWWLGWTGEDD